MEAVELAFILMTAFELILIFYQKREFDKLKRYFEKHEHSKKMKDVIVID